MGKKLAIEHHLIRPNEVIELLEMMGGKNKDNADGNETFWLCNVTHVVFGEHPNMLYINKVICK